MPKNMHLLNDLITRYGKQEAENVYWGMVGEAKGPFAKGAKYYQEHVDFAQRNGLATIRPKKKAASRRKRPRA